MSSHLRPEVGLPGDQRLYQHLGELLLHQFAIPVVWGRISKFRMPGESIERALRNSSLLVFRIDSDSCNVGMKSDLSPMAMPRLDEAGWGINQKFTKDFSGEKDQGSYPMSRLSTS
jgi:hypothetical protein